MSRFIVGVLVTAAVCAAAFATVGDAPADSPKEASPATTVTVPRAGPGAEFLPRRKAYVPGWLRCPRVCGMAARRTPFMTHEPGEAARRVREAAAAGANVFCVPGIYRGEAWYPSTVAPHAPRLRDTDYLAEATTAGARAAVRILVTLDAATMYPDHPAWPDAAAHDADGRPTGFGEAGAYVVCPNSPAFRDYLTRVLDEALRRYPVAGVCVEGLEPHRCFCPHCRRKYRALFGEDMPIDALKRIPEWWSLWRHDSQPQWVGPPSKAETQRYTRFLYQSRIDAMHLVRETVKRIRPTAVVLFDAFPKPRTVASYDGAVVPAAFACACPAPAVCPVAPEAAAPPAEVAWRMFQVLAAGGYPSVRRTEGARPVFRYMTRRSAYLDVSRREAVPFLMVPRPAGPTAGHVALAAARGLSRREAPGEWLAPGAGLKEAVARAGLPAVGCQASDFHHGLPRFRVLCLADAVCLSDEQVAFVRRFVSRGGSLVATHETSLADHLGQPRQQLALADVFGIEATGRLAPAARTVEWTAEARALPFAGAPPALVHTQGHLVVKPTTGTVAARLRGPGIGDPGAPAVILNTFGRGRVVYLPGRWGRQEATERSAEVESLVAAAVRWVAGGEVPVEIAAPGPVAPTLFDQPGRRIVHLVNHGRPLGSGSPVPTPMAHLLVRLRPPAGMRVSQVEALFREQALRFKEGDGYVDVYLPRLDAYEALAVTWARP